MYSFYWNKIFQSLSRLFTKVLQLEIELRELQLTQFSPNVSWWYIENVCMILIFWLDFEIDELYLNASSLTDKKETLILTLLQLKLQSSRNKSTKFPKLGCLHKFCTVFLYPRALLPCMGGSELNTSTWIRNQTKETPRLQS